jgi:putative ABC transport system permease protein
VARAALRVIAPVVPSERREEWRDEWSAELWHDLALRERHTIGVTDGLGFAWRVAGAIPHAVQVRRYDWRLDMVIQDLEYALRGTLRRPVFTSLVVATLALGIGVNTAMFTVVNSVLIQPLPYHEPSQLVLMYGSFSKFDRASISPPDFVDYRAQNTVFSSFAGKQLDGSAVLTGDGDPEQVTATSVTANYFATLGVAPLRGRTFVPAEERAGAPDVALVSYGLWQRRFGGDPNLVGRQISVDGRMRTVVGVMPQVLDQTLGIQVWRPMQFQTPETSTRRFHFMRAIGRLKPGVSLEQAQTGMDAIARQLETAYPENATWHLNLIPLRDAVIGDVGRLLVMLLASVGLVLLVACGNVASLLLARASARRGEIAIRTALGASRSRLLRQLLTESLMLSTPGGLVGLVLAAALVRSVRAAGDGMLPRLAEVSIDPTVLAFTVVLSIVTGVIFGLAPALHAVRGNLSAAFGTLGKGSGGAGAARARDGLVVAQVALSLVLLSGAGLLLRSLWKLQHVDPGFAPDHVLTAQLSLPDTRYPTRDVRLEFWRALAERTRALPGVRLSSMTTMLPLRGGGDTYYYIEGQPPATDADRRNAQISSVGDDYFATMRIPMIAGRAFDASERSGGPNSIIISRRMAARLFPNESAIGKRLVVDFGKPFTGAIVGVAGDVRAFGLASRPPDVMYFSLHQSGGFSGGASGNVILRTQEDPLALAAALRATVASIDRDIPLASLAAMDDIVARSTSRERFSARLLAGFAASALLLAVVGLYGVLAYVVTQRTRELGIRIALGASRREIFALVARRGLFIVGLGVCLGLAGALLASRFLERMLFEVGRTDPAVFVAVTAALVAAGAAACIVPARQATRVDPLAALRAEG